jgi:hypothetical protein
MTYNFNKMTNWELDKANFLIRTARKLGMDLQGYGEVSVNEHSGYTYLWCEDYPFSLYMPISCELYREDVYVMWTNSYDGEEVEESLAEFEELKDIYRWVELLEAEED